MDRIKELMAEVAGLETEAELKSIYDAVVSCKPKIAVEIGCLFGLSSSVIAEAMNGEGKLICIDNFAVQGSDTKPHFITKVLPKYPIMTLMEMDSSKAAHEFFQPVDFLFVDGDHQDDGIQRDLKNWLPKMVSGGVIIFHDYFNYMFPNIAIRVNEYARDYETIGQQDSLIIKRVP